MRHAEAHDPGTRGRARAPHRRRKRAHGRVHHAAKRRAIGAVHSNTIDGFWSIFKRGIVGSFRKISRKYLPLYIAEFQFRYNNRMSDDIYWTAIEGC